MLSDRPGTLQITLSIRGADLHEEKTPSEPPEEKMPIRYRY